MATPRHAIFLEMMGGAAQDTPELIMCFDEDVFIKQGVGNHNAELIERSQAFFCQPALSSMWTH